MERTFGHAFEELTVAISVLQIAFVTLGEVDAVAARHPDAPRVATPPTPPSRPPADG